MIKVTIPAAEFFDESTYKFFTTKETTIALEHSLVSISKWESETEKPFIGKELTPEETELYVKCMTITQNVDPLIYSAIPATVMKQISDYINRKQTATWFRDDGQKRGPKRVVTSELIYYWMIQCGIPWECEKWHINRLLTLIRVCQEENKPNKQLSYKERAALNAARKKKFHTKG